MHIIYVCESQQLIKIKEANLKVAKRGVWEGAVRGKGRRK